MKYQNIIFGGGALDGSMSRYLFTSEIVRRTEWVPLYESIEHNKKACNELMHVFDQLRYSETGHTIRFCLFVLRSSYDLNHLENE